MVSIKKFVFKGRILIYKNYEGQMTSSRPYVPIQVSSQENGMSLNSKSLEDTGANRAVVSSDLVKKLNMKIHPTRVQARDTGNWALPILGEVTLNFSCHCQTHKGKKKISKTTLILESLSEDCLIPFDLSIELNLLTF